MQLRLNRIVSQGIVALLSPYAVCFCGRSLCAVIVSTAPLGDLGREL
ncbi:hypothetical protein CAMGR0001_1432 [Campylobacter gracilis RM3268]|uniref:Uncharacterized protein n=1 Tax=Campylobacter gracilis RM3268 TaxID=553220 RepID=C8PJN2_9BACT|nr:hypothetical protein CAMGR0001_1432 [Campylobacter gracilis RM3268]